MRSTPAILAGSIVVRRTFRRAKLARQLRYAVLGDEHRTYAVFGGIDVWFGGVLGAVALSYLPVLLQVFDHWRLEVHGAIILIVMGLRPQGVLALDLFDMLQSRRQRWRSPRGLAAEPLHSAPLINPR